MTDFVLLGASALWLGVLTSISPCPLATNVAAVSFIGRRFNSGAQVAMSGMFYVLGRMLTYIALGVALISGLLSAPQISGILQRHMNKVLGPILVLVGMVLLDLIRLGFPGFGPGERMRARAESGGAWGAVLLGVVFALSFCPVSAALFFGTLIPLSVRQGSRVLLPMLYGVGTGLPVILFAVLIAFGARSLSSVFDTITRAERWVRPITGGIFILVGIYYCLVYIFEVL